MSPVDRDVALLWDMLNACRQVRGFTRDVDWADFIADRSSVDYGQIEYEIIYGTVTKDVPPLLATLEQLLPAP